MTEPRYLRGWQLRKRVKMLLSDTEKVICLGEPDTIDSKTHFDCFRLRFIKEVKMQV